MSEQRRYRGRGNYDPNETDEQLAARLARIKEFVAEVNKQPPLTVHVLYAGLPLCFFSRNMPLQWPAGHKWVGIHDWRMANCTVCVDAAAKMQGGNRAG